MRWITTTLIALLLSTCSPKTELPAIRLKAYAEIDGDYEEETSGIVKSRQYPDVFWVHDDSGNDDKIFAINSLGEAASGDKDYKGQKIKGTDNDDWEDILTDDEGHIIIADIGNNCECRDDLAFYYVKETSAAEEENEVLKHIPISYPDVKNLPELIDAASFNSEAAFFFDGKLYLFTKHSLLLGKTRLYRLDSYEEGEDNVLTFIKEFGIDGPVTAADSSPDGKRVAVLTYNSVWLLETGDDGSFLSGKTFTRKVIGSQIEGITFDGDTLIITDEKRGRMYRLAISELEEISSNN